MLYVSSGLSLSDSGRVQKGFVSSLMTWPLEHFVVYVSWPSKSFNTETSVRKHSGFLNVIWMVRFSPQRHGGWPYIKTDPGSQQHHVAEKLKITCKCYSAQPLCDLFFEFTFDVYVLPTGHLTIMDLQSFCYLFCSTRSFLQTFKDVSQLLVYFLWFWIQPSGKQIFLS